MPYRFYSYVAGGYISELQKGLQTGHAIADMSVEYMSDSAEHQMYEMWAQDNKTIIICSVFNSAGVVEQYQKLQYYIDQCDLNMPVVQFNEDTQSLNGAPTACGVVVPDFIYEAEGHYVDGRLERYTVTRNGVSSRYFRGDNMFQLIELIRTPKLA